MRSIYPDGDSTTQFYTQFKRLKKKIEKGESLKRPDNFNNKEGWLWIEICTPCWKILPGKRLSAQQAVAKFAELDAPQTSNGFMSFLSNFKFNFFFW